MPLSKRRGSTAAPADRRAAAVESLARSDYSRALNLSVLALGNFFLFYITNMALARKLSVRDFDDYSVALSIVNVLGTLATLGLEKYALRCIPVYRERGDWSHLRGFWRFSLVTIIAASIILVTILALSLQIVLVSRGADAHAAVILLAAILPLIAVVLFLVEVATASGAQIPALVIYRFMLPASFFVLVHVADQFELLDSAISVAICYGLAWLLALFAIYQLSLSSMPVDVRHASPSFLRKKWLRRSAPFLINSGMLSVIASSGVIILEILFTSEAVVGIYAVALQTGTFIVLLANTTNRFYLPLMSLYIERRDSMAMRRLMRHRLAVIGGLATAFLAGIILFGEDILGWFGPSFREGYSALCVLSAGAVANALFSDSPYFLQFLKQEQAVFLSTSVGVALNLGLTVLLGHRLGALGAAYGYSIGMAVLFLSQRWLVARHLRLHWRRAVAEQPVAGA
jgi:O-antigen/teichoic acid export membrane protein